MRALSDPSRSIAVLGAQLHGGPLHHLRVETREISGGLESGDVVHVIASYQDAAGRRRRWPLVIKHLRGEMVREADVYQGLVAAHASAWSPRLLAVERGGPSDARMYLEALYPVSRWPWRDTSFARQVLDRLAGLHAAELSPSSTAALVAWNYDAELEASAVSTLEMLAVSRRDCRLPFPSGTHQRVRRVILALGAMRRQLMDFPNLGRAPIHGDIHPGNVLVRRRAGTAEPALLDWSRARIGSPLEDVSSWLQSLGYWEPETRRRHDTLLAHYLRSRGADGRLLPDFRVAYWLAGASNALSGALRYHLSVALDHRTGRVRRASAARAARDWLRVLRRADAYWN